MTSCQGGLGTGTLYTYAQLEGLWINAGGPKALAPTMAAIAEAESGGCSTAYNPSGATGLWQILGAVDPSDQAQLTNPAVNAKEAVLKYKSQGLGAWVTYTSGAYKAYMNGATTPDTSVPGSGGTCTATATLTSASSATAADCLIGGWSVGVSVASFNLPCLLSKSEARGLIGGLLLAVSVSVGLVGAVILAAAAFQRTGALGKAADAAAVVPGAGVVAAGLSRAHSRVTRTGAQAARQRTS